MGSLSFAFCFVALEEIISSAENVDFGLLVSPAACHLWVLDDVSISDVPECCLVTLEAELMSASSVLLPSTV